MPKTNHLKSINKVYYSKILKNIIYFIQIQFNTFVSSFS